jgi:hypothetical protein
MILMPTDTRFYDHNKINKYQYTTTLRIWNYCDLQLPEVLMMVKVP